MRFKSILHPEFKYRDSISTDIRLTFDRIRAEQANAERPVSLGAEVKIVERSQGTGRASRDQLRPQR